MKTLLFLLIGLLIPQFCLAATACELTDLSKKYVYLLTAAESKNEYGAPGISQLDIQVLGKAKRNLIQRLTLKTEYISGDLKDCQSAATAVGEVAFARSYLTGKNAQAEVDDNDWGVFIVGDFNFDGLEDFAVQREFHNTGAVYEYFTQNKGGTFVKDGFLTEEVRFFGDLDAKNKTITTSTAATTAGYAETTFKYNPITKKWRLLKSIHRKTG